MNDLIVFTSFLPEDVSLPERRYYFLNDLTEIKKCPVCGKKVGFWNNKHRPYNFCSVKCRNSKRGKEISYSKCSDTWKLKTTDEISAINDKRSKTFLKTIGVTHPNKCEAFRNKNIERTRKEYGVDYYFQSEEFKRKFKQINYEKLHVEFPRQSKEVQEKGFLTRRKNYYSKFIKTLKERFIETMFSMKEYVQARTGDTLKFKCLRCGDVFEFKLVDNIIRSECISCPNTIHKVASCYETEIYEWLKYSDIKNIERNKRKWKNRKRKFEADIFLPDYNLAIEFNGLYWHSNAYRVDDYHYNKWKFFKEQGIDCIQIFENEWLLKNDIVKDTILKRLNKVEVRINDNDCLLKELNEEEYRLFVEQNYIKEYEEAEVKIGLFYNNELVQCLGVKKDKNEWMIVCVCSKLNCIVENGLNKLLNYFKEHWKGNIIVYVDNRYFDGKEYIENGFKYICHSNVNYFYFKSNDLCLNNTINNICDHEKEKCFYICDCGYDVFKL